MEMLLFPDCLLSAVITYRLFGSVVITEDMPNRVYVGGIRKVNSKYIMEAYIVAPAALSLI